MAADIRFLSSPQQPLCLRNRQQPGQVYQVATGDSQPGAPGYKCGDKPIWNNSGETIFLKTSDGQLFQANT